MGGRPGIPVSLQTTTLCPFSPEACFTNRVWSGDHLSNIQIGYAVAVYVHLLLHISRGRLRLHCAGLRDLFRTNTDRSGKTKTYSASNGHCRDIQLLDLLVAQYTGEVAG